MSQPSLLPRLRRFAVLAFIAYSGIVAAMYVAQRSLLFPGAALNRALPAPPPAFQAITLQAADGTRLAAWIRPPAPGQPVILYLHGNGGSLASPGRVQRFSSLVAEGAGLLALSWRGYAGSDGSPSEDGLHMDARAAHDHLRTAFPQAPVAIYGESLGTGPAVKLAGEVPVAALVLESPFLSTAAVAQGTYFFLPVHLLMKDPFRSDLRIGRVTAPLLVMHGRQDGVVPFAQGRALYDMATAPKRFADAPDANHVDLPRFGSLRLAREFITDALAGRITGAAEITLPTPRDGAGG
jgi:fermentation-respiration switch protein FrsA (DUF1100 family)